MPATRPPRRWTRGATARAARSSGLCVDADEIASSTPCLICDPTRSIDDWSNNDGVACDDFAFCTGADACGGGSCSVHEGSPCADDGLFCNGSETCDDVLDECVSVAPPCSDDGLFCNGNESCDEDGDACLHDGSPCADGECSDDLGMYCARAAFLGCDAGADVVSVSSCGLEEGVVEQCSDGFESLCVSGVCGCLPGWTGTDCERCVTYVDAATGDDSGRGHSWSDALATLQEALERSASDRCDIFVAEGTYYPSNPAGRDATFQLVTGVALYGGFYGGEIRPSQRDIAAHPSVLSGDIGAPGDATDNAHHVVHGASGARLDGFVIIGGNADDFPSWSAGYGGAAEGWSTAPHPPRSPTVPSGTTPPPTTAARCGATAPPL